MMEESDAALVTRAREGDQDAFGVLVENHSQALFRLAFRMTGNEHDAEDIVQETFLRAHRQLGRFESRASFRTWLHRIAANCSLDLLRKRQRHRDEDDAVDLESAEAIPAMQSRAPAPDQELLHAEVHQQVVYALEQLTPMERTAFVLRHFEGRSIAEIGTTLGAGSNATKQSIFRAVQKIRRALEPMVKATP